VRLICPVSLQHLPSNIAIDLEVEHCTNPTNPIPNHIITMTQWTKETFTLNTVSIDSPPSVLHC